MSNNNLPGSKRAQEPDFTNCDSQDVTSECEPCEEALKCLVHVEFENKQDSKKYEWKAGSGDLAKDSKLQIIGFQEEGEGNSYEPFDIKYSIKDSKCIHNQEICTKLYLIEENGIYGKPIDAELKRFSEQSNTLHLDFNKKYLEKLTEYIPYYLSLDEDEKGNTIVEKLTLDLPVIGKQFGEMGGKLMKYSFDYLPESEYPGGVSRIISTLKRMVNFACRSQFSHMPATAYHVAVQECVDPYTDILKITLPKTVEKNVNQFFDKASATAYAFPHYSIKYNVKLYYKSLKIGSPDGKGTSTINVQDMKATSSQRNGHNKDSAEKMIENMERSGYIFGDEEEKESEIKESTGREATFASELIMQWMKNLKFSFGGVEYFNGVKGGEFNVEFTEIVKNIIEIFTKTHPAFSLFATVVDFGRKLLEKGGYLTLTGNGLPGPVYEIEYDPSRPDLHKIKEFKAELPRNRAFRIDITPPSFELSGETQLENKGGKYNIKHKDLKLKLEPILAGSITFNLSILLMKTVRPVYGAFLAAQGFCTFLENSGDLLAPGSVSANIIVDSEKTVAQINREKNASIAVSLLIYCQIIVSSEIKATLSYADKASLNIPASVDIDNMNGDLDLEFKAGASFHARVWIFRLGAEVGISAKTGGEIGVEKLSRMSENGTAYDELIFYFLFKGLEIAYFARGTVGVDVVGNKGEGGGFYEESNDPSYYDEQTATDRLVQQAAWDKEWQELYDKKYKELQKKYGVLGEDYYYNKMASEYAYKNIDPQYSKKELSDLQDSWFGLKKGHAKIYTDYATEFSRLAELNALLKVEKNLATRERYLLERLQLQNKLNSYVVDADLPTTAGSYHHEDLTVEQEWRKELRDYLNKNFEEATSRQDLNTIRDNIKKLEELDKDISSVSILPPYLGLPNDTLTEKERIDLTRKLLDPLLERTL